MKKEKLWILSIFAGAIVLLLAMLALQSYVGVPTGAAVADLDMCSRNVDCVSGVCKAGTCLTPGGMYCVADQECVSGKCSGYACLKSPGETCDADSECLTGQCYDRGCQKRSGQICYEDGECMSGKCKDKHCLKQSGQTCEVDGECAGNICADGRCLQMLQGTCKADDECSSGTCIFERCLKLSGEDCVDGDNCASGVCYNNVCTKLPGEKCLYSDQCSTGVCRDGKCQGCVDTDGGPNFHIKGYLIGSFYDSRYGKTTSYSHVDKCFVQKTGGGSVFVEVDECGGDDLCYVEEAYCVDASKPWDFDRTRKCEVGCKDGRCLGPKTPAS